jgi:hypothetical protein
MHRILLQFGRLNLRHLALGLAAISCVALSAEFAFASQVLKSKGNIVLIQMDDTKFNEGDKIFVMVGGKKKGLVTITQVKGSRAKGTIDKGVAPDNAPVTLAKAGSGAPPTSSSSDSPPPRSRRSRTRTASSRVPGLSIGGLVGYGMDSQSATGTNSLTGTSESINMAGTGYSVKGFADLPILGNLSLTGRAGVEMFNVSGTSSLGLCANGSSCTTSITYIALDALMRYNFPLGGWTPFVEGGLGLHYPLAKTSNILGTVSATTVFFAGAGANIKLSEKSYIPIVLEYGLFPPSPQVKTTLIALRAGYAVMF